MNPTIWTFGHYPANMEAPRARAEQQVEAPGDSPYNRAAEYASTVPGIKRGDVVVAHRASDGAIFRYIVRRIVPATVSFGA